MHIQPLTLNKGQWFTEPTRKRAIVGHCTAGPSVMSAVNDWNRTPVQIGTAFIIDETGTIFQCFPANHWAYHTGTGEAYDKSSIGVELVNPGWLKFNPADNSYRAWFTGRDGQGVVYNDRRYDHGSLWRGQRFYATYPPVQVRAFAELVANLLRDHRIEPAFWDPRRFLDYAPTDGKNFNGFLPHSVLSNQRYDLGPAFPYASFITQVKDLQ